MRVHDRTVAAVHAVGTVFENHRMVRYDCGCEQRGGNWDLCRYHDGFNDALSAPPVEGAYRIALRPDEDGADPFKHVTLLDDIVVNGVSCFRAEAMSADEWFVCCYLSGTDDDGTEDRIAWSVRAVKGRAIEWTTTEYPTVEVTYEDQ